VSYRPPDSVVVDRIKRAFPPDELRDRGRALVERERKFDFVALFYTLAFGFAAGSDRSIQAFLDQFLEMSDCDTLEYSSFHEWFTPALVGHLREILDEAIENLDPGQNDLRGRLERFRDVIILDKTFIPLYEDAADVFAGYREEFPGAQLNVAESLSTGQPTKLRLTDGKEDERSQLPTGEWVADKLLLFDLGYYSFWWFERIDANDGWFVTRVKENANPEIVEELRVWRGNAIDLEGKSLQDVLDDLQRQEIEALVRVSFDRKRGSSRTDTAEFRLVGLLNEETDEYHLYFTNLPRKTYKAPDIAQLYRARWEIELLFKELKSRFRLDEIKTTDPYLIRALIIIAVISLMLSRVIVDELHELRRAQREMERAADADSDESASRLPRRRGSHAIERHSHLIYLYLMLDLGYELPDLDDLLLWAIEEPNPHRRRLREQVESGETD